MEAAAGSVLQRRPRSSRARARAAARSAVVEPAVVEPAPSDPERRAPGDATGRPRPAGSRPFDPAAATARRPPGPEAARPARTSASGPRAGRPATNHAPPSATPPTPSGIHGSTHAGIARPRTGARRRTQRRRPAASRHPRTDPQTVTWSRISSSVAGPMPLTSSRSSTETNGPFCSRYSTIVAASTSPIPDSVSSSVAEAVLMLTRPPEEPGAAARDAGHGRPRLRHEDLRAVDEHRSQVQQAEVRLRHRPARSLDRVDDPLPLRELVDARLPDRPRDVHDEQRGAGSATATTRLGGAGPRLGDRHRLGQRARVPEPGAAQAPPPARRSARRSPRARACPGVPGTTWRGR